MQGGQQMDQIKQKLRVMEAQAIDLQPYAEFYVGYMKAVQQMKEFISSLETSGIRLEA